MNQPEYPGASAAGSLTEIVFVEYGGTNFEWPRNESLFCWLKTT